MVRSNIKDRTWEDAVQTVLSEADGALHYSEIAQLISSRRLKQKIGANPAASVAAILSKSLENEGTPFQRVGKGEYALKDKLIQDAQLESAASGAEQVASESETGALRAFGMFWQRSLVSWTGKPRLLGRAQLAASLVNFADQVGVYLLHDRDRVIYVGRASTDSLFPRLKAHTTDRLGGRWDRFSWFGLRAVGDDGTLIEANLAWSHDIVIETLEALLIESLEPPLNRRRGDNLAAIEFLQGPDPEFEAQRKKQLVAEFAQQIGLQDT